MEDKREYQQMSSKGKKVEGSSDQLHEVSPSDNAVSNGGLPHHTATTTAGESQRG